MENKIQKFQFKTNINCGGCIAKVTPFLNQAEGLEHWEVDTTDKNKILTVNSGGISEQQVIDIVRKAGYKIEVLEA
ncbi:MAG: heavy-metal-associated domain-containing protein [Bacteroidales bacterium]|jgi:copper chaperone CopZ|nr:heavy-metal-associated domain-containing protein [Bacteroidales bacterium]